MDESLGRSATTEDHPARGKLAGASLRSGQVLANRFEVRRSLGQGGMGEVWLAFDLRLRVDVALKALLTSGGTDILRREIRAARVVISPNVCRIFDLVEADGIELLSMEFIDGDTLREVLDERSPLDLREAQQIASQFLSGLEAIHCSGLVHRDFKPSNVMITRTGRVVVMDFGLAKPAFGDGSRAGTPVYMAPEQSRGEVIDRRADVFAAGVVLVEMITPEGVREHSRRDIVWTGVRQRPTWLPDTPWAAVLRKALAHEADERYASASDLARALEDVTQRLGASEEGSPYPGLSPFTESQTAYFFGREAEVEVMWRKLSGPARLVGLIGPSGAGKSSFLRAGLIAAQPDDCRILIATPGNRPFASVARKLAPEISGDVDAIAALADFDQIDAALSLMKSWRQKSAAALLLVDQFEELFTLNPFDVQQRFAVFLSRLTLECDVHVVLSLRDDFLLRCHEFEALAPLFADLTPLKVPAGDSLRRAIVQPALECGYRFEDEALIDDVLNEAASSRGALPLAAFAMARLWERRDRHDGVLTRASYTDIGGVGGALAQHAETTLEQIGAGHVASVREIFRNLVTAQGTRAARDREDLLSIFTDRQGAGKVLDSLIDARLLTAYETEDKQRIEIIHESLLGAWPRLVRWQTQDADGAQLRDHLRQSAHVWDERSRPDELLWTGNAYREFRLWRSRYVGALSRSEEEFANAMVSKAERHKRRWRLGVTGVLALAVGLAVTMSVLWRTSIASRRVAVASERHATAAARRAEAQKLLALAQVELSRNPTAALAYAMQSLEVNDTVEGRRRVLEILARGPIARLLQTPDGDATMVTFSPNDKWLAVSSSGEPGLLIPSDGGPPRRIDNPPSLGFQRTGFSPDSRFVAVGADFAKTVYVFSVPDGRLIRTFPKTDPGGIRIYGPGILSLSFEAEQRVVRSWGFADGGGDIVYRFSLPTGVQVATYRHDVSFQAYIQNHTVFRRAFGTPMGEPRPIWQLLNDANSLQFDKMGGRLAAIGDRGLEVFSFADHSVQRLTMPTADDANGVFGGERIAVWSGNESGGAQVMLWDLKSPLDAVPITVRTAAEMTVSSCDLSANGQWLASATNSGLIGLWPLLDPPSQVIRARTGYVQFSADSRHLASCGVGGPFRLVSLDPNDKPIVRSDIPSFGCGPMATDDLHTQLLIAGPSVYTLDFSSKPARTILPFQQGMTSLAVAFDRTGEWAAAYVHDFRSTPLLKLIRIRTGEVRRAFRVETPARALLPIRNLAFGADGALYSAGAGGVRRWNIETGAYERIYGHDSGNAMLAMSENRRVLLVAFGRPALNNLPDADLVLFDLEKRTQRKVTSHRRAFSAMALNKDGAVIATADISGVIRVGSSSGASPHMLVGHDSQPWSIAFSPDGRSLASATGTEIRIWRMPDVSNIPLHELPHSDLLLRLRQLTNLRAVPDESAAAGYKLSIGPFPGWNAVPDQTLLPKRTAEAMHP